MTGESNASVGFVGICLFIMNEWHSMFDSCRAFVNRVKSDGLINLVSVGVTTYKSES